MKHDGAKDIPKINRIQPVQDFGNGRAKEALTNVNQQPWIIYVYVTILSLAVIIAAYIQFQWGKKIDGMLAPEESVLSPISTMINNFKLLLRGYREGYFRSIWGYFIFGLMSSFFLSVGRYVMKLIQGSTEVFSHISLPETISIYYLIGSLIASLLSLGFGVWGLVGFKIGLLTGLLGLCLFIYEMRNFGLLYRTMLSSFRSFTSLERALVTFIVMLMVIWSTTSIKNQTYSDTLITHLTLPNFYLNEGHVKFNPYHIHSYFPQNTEMLTLWALALRSEVAAALVVWGFLVAFILLIWGFITRHTNSEIGVLSIFTFLFAPVFSWFSTTIKNDFQVGVFIVAHYVALAEFIREYPKDQKAGIRWLFLAGILAGGSIGHKLTAIPAVTISTLLILVAIARQSHSRHDFYKWVCLWLLGLSMSCGPWMLRTFLETGNPIYPYFGNFLSTHLVEPWHKSIPQATSLLTTGWQGLFAYGKELLGLSFSQGEIQPPNWGPSILFIFFAVSCLFIKLPSNLKLILTAAIISYVLIFSYSLEPRYQIGFLVLLSSGGFAFMTHALRQLKFGKFAFIPITLCLVLMSLQNLSHSRMINILRSSSSILLSGFPVNDYKTTDSTMDSLRWIDHLLETRTPKEEAVLYAGIHYAYGLKRKSYFSSDLDKQFIAMLASQSSSTQDLVSRLKGLGINHILMHKNFFETYANHPNPNLQIQRRDLNLIQDCLHQYIVMRFRSPNGQIYWFSMNDNTLPKQVFLNTTDAMGFSSLYIEQCQDVYTSGNPQLARQLLEQIRELSLPPLNIAYAAGLLGSIYSHLGNKSEAEQVLLQAVQRVPNRPEPYLNLAIFYAKEGNTDRARALVKSGIKHGGERMAKHTVVLSGLVSQE